MNLTEQDVKEMFPSGRFKSFGDWAKLEPYGPDSDLITFSYPITKQDFITLCKRWNLNYEQPKRV